MDEETETETETDSNSMTRWSGGIGGSGSGSGSAKVNGHGYPFPKVTRSPLNPHAHAKEEKEWRYALDAPDLQRNPERGSMVLLEGMWLEGVGCVGVGSCLVFFPALFLTSSLHL
jgi:hypothetical protein